MKSIPLYIINNEVFVYLSLAFISIFSPIVFLLKKMYNNNKTLTRINDLAEKRDNQINVLIEKINEMDKKLQPLIDYHNKKQYLMELKQAIEAAGDLFIPTCSDEEFKKIASHGLEEAYVFFSTIYKEGLDNINFERITTKAINGFSRLRASHAQDNHISDGAVEVIKALAYRSIGELIRQLKGIKGGLYDSDQETTYKNIANKFVYSFLVESHKLF